MEISIPGEQGDVHGKISSSMLLRAVQGVVVVAVVVVSHIQRIGCQPPKLLYTVANPARCLLNREKRTNEKVWQRTPSPHPTLLVLRK